MQINFPYMFPVLGLMVLSSRKSFMLYKLELWFSTISGSQDCWSFCISWSRGNVVSWSHGGLQTFLPALYLESNRGKLVRLTYSCLLSDIRCFFFPCLGGIWLLILFFGFNCELLFFVFLFSFFFGILRVVVR